MYVSFKKKLRVPFNYELIARHSMKSIIILGILSINNGNIIVFKTKSIHNVQ